METQGFSKITDMTRAISIIILAIHLYITCYTWFDRMQWTSQFSDRILFNLINTNIFDGSIRPKLISLTFLCMAMLGIKGMKQKDMDRKKAFAEIIFGIILFFGSIVFDSSIAYMIATILGYLLILSGLTMLTRYWRSKWDSDVFDRLHESFPQAQMKIGNEYSINLETQYFYNKKKHRGWINIINPFRGTLIMGNPGSGKTRFVIEPMIDQMIAKGYGMFVYDFKFDDLTKFTFDRLQMHGVNKKTPTFYALNFDDLSRSHRCNPLHPSTMHDITDAAEAALTVLLGLNQNWISKQSDFFVKSAINFVKSLIWYLRITKGGKYCTLPHVVELARTDYAKLFSVLRTIPEIDIIINPFVSAYLNDAKEQLEGQVGSARISLSDLASPLIYWVMTGDDFTLDINDMKQPKIICMGNNPQKAQTYGAVISLYINTMIRQINRKGGQHSALIFDEFPTLYLHGIDRLIATARSNKVAPVLCMQDASQLKNYYGRELAEVIMHINGNVITGQVSGDSAKQISDRFGKIHLERESYSVNSRDVSVSHSRHAEPAVPPSRIANLSSGEFAGIIADDPATPIDQKGFLSKILRAKNLDGQCNRSLPVIQNIDAKQVEQNAVKIRKDIEVLINEELHRMMDTPELEHLIINKKS
jgi:hypothetical protein